MNERILIVDDDTDLLQALRRQLRKKFDLRTAEGGKDALVVLETDGPFAVVMCDMQMPEMNGIEVLDKFKELAPETVRMMLTGNADQQTAIDAINRGNIFRFFNKPCNSEELAEGIDAGLVQYRLQTAERELLEKTLAGSIKILTDVLSMIDAESFGSAATVRDWAREIAADLGMKRPWKLDMAAMLSPIGQVSIPPDILIKMRAGAPLSATETAMVERVPQISRDLIANIPRMKDVANIIYYQGKNFDGSGLPKDDVAGENIPLESRILKLLGDLARVTRGRGPTFKALTKLKQNDDWYCPKVVNAAETWLTRRQEAAGKDGEDTSFQVPAKLLKCGYTLLSDLTTDDGHLILSAGARLSEIQVERIRNLGETVKFAGPVRVAR
jgi:response regulator RpfG family c-di-GMP phosphodiesterase